MKFDEEFSYLIEYTERENAIEVMSDWLKYPKDYHSETCVKVLNERIVEPLSRWLENEWQQVKGNPNNYVHIKAAQGFMIYAEDLVYRFKNNLTILPEHISVFDEKWHEFQFQIGQGASRRVEKFDKARWMPKVDSLRMLMSEVFLDFVQKHNRQPKARELFDALPIDGKIIQEIDDDVIYWKSKNGKEKTTTFKKFQDRLTPIKKIYIERFLKK